jgi:hypothetical protein
MARPGREVVGLLRSVQREDRVLVSDDAADRQTRGLARGAKRGGLSGSVEEGDGEDGGGGGCELAQREEQQLLLVDQRR